MSNDSPRPDISIVFTNWNTREYLRNCLRSVYEKTGGVTYDVIVVDDGSTDGSVEMLRKEFPEVHRIVNERNLGVAKAYNRGVAQARGRYVQMLNTDMLLINNAIKILFDFLESHPNAGACGAWLRNPDMTSQVSFGYFPSFLQGMTDLFFLNDLFPHAGLPSKGICPDERMREPIAVEYVTGASMLIRKDIIDSLGFFDERFTSYCEETDFCYRVMREARLKLYFVPAAQIIHFGGASFSSVRKYQIQLMCSSYHKFFTKHHGAVYSFVTRLLYAVHYAVKFVVRALRYLVSPAAQRGEKKSSMQNARYIVRYCLAPTEKFTGR